VIAKLKVNPERTFLFERIGIPTTSISDMLKAMDLKKTGRKMKYVRQMNEETAYGVVPPKKILYYELIEVAEL
jgi:hypothetical protein